MSLGLDTDYLLEDFLGGFSPSDYIDDEYNDYDSSNYQDNIKAEEILYVIEIYNGVSSSLPKCCNINSLISKKLK